MLRKFARVGLAVVVSLVVLAVLIVAAQRVANAVSKVKSPTDSLFGNGSTTNTASNGAVTIRNGSGGDATMPPAPEYTLGMWASDMTPGGTTTIYARVSQNSAPVPGVTVSISFNGRSLATNTNGFGIAAFTIPASGAHGQPVTVNGSVHINGQEIDADTFYTP